MFFQNLILPQNSQFCSRTFDKMKLNSINKYIPYDYTPSESFQTFHQAELFLINNLKLKNQIEELGWVYYSIGNLIPQTTENFWSGHFFPYTESWNELQVSFNLVLFGFYKQAFMSLRSGLELGLLSVYYNINDEGHKTVQEWLKSKDNWEADTPRLSTIWKILISNKNINSFNQKYDLKRNYDELCFLHNYVHTKGYKFSNKMGILKSNFQTFEKKCFSEWINTYEKVVIIITTLHLLKYPIGIIKFDWSKKCGIDNPYPVLQEFEIDRITRFLPNNYLKGIQDISKEDIATQELLAYISDLPDMNEEDFEEQILEINKSFISCNQRGFLGWEKQQKKRIKTLDKDSQKRMLDRNKYLKQWAKENNVLT